MHTKSYPKIQQVYCITTRQILYNMKYRSSVKWCGILSFGSGYDRVARNSKQATSSQKLCILPRHTFIPVM